MHAYDIARGGPPASPGFLLWHVTLRWQSALATRLEPLGLTPAQFCVLGAAGWLTRQPGAELPTQRDVAAQAGTDPMMTSQLLRVLERRGLLKRLADANDGRVRRVRVTTKGRAQLRQALAVVHATDRDFFHAPLRDVSRFAETLRALARAAGVPAAVVGNQPKENET